MKKFSFSLSETLIALVILGIIAVLTIPNLIQREKEKQTVTAVKKIYAELNNAFDTAQIINGPVISWTDVTKNLFERRTIYTDYIINPYFKIEKSCGLSNEGCGLLSNEECKFLNGTVMQNDRFNYCSPSANAATYSGAWNRTLLQNGMTIAIKTPRGNGENGENLFYNLGYRPIVAVDINGEKEPNTLGKDVFLFVFDKQKGLIPLNDNSCNNKGQTGASCADYIIKNSNMNYLRK